MLKLVTKADLDALHTGNVKEGLHLEYKASGAVDKKDDSKKIEMARDVAAFANSDGGQIIYGMTEKDHDPTGLDGGLDPKAYPEIWFEQVLQQHVTPSIRGFRIRHVPIAAQSVAVVIDVPATKGDPHQVSDGRYYRRHNFNRLPMEHYEIRDAFSRSTTPELFVQLALPRGDNTAIEFAHRTEISKPVVLTALVGNESAQPAFHTQVFLGIDEEIEILSIGDFVQAPRSPDGGVGNMIWLMRWLSSPPLQPIFKEAMPAASSVALGFHSRFASGSTIHRFPITVIVQTPGHSVTEQWIIWQQGLLLELKPQ